MLHAPWSRRTVGLVASAASLLLVAACSDPAPPPAPAPSAPASVAPSSTAPSSPAASSAAPTTPAPAPSGTTAAPRPNPSGDGSIEPSRPVETAAPKKLDQPTKTAGASVSLVFVKTARIKASTPGDSSGPGVLVRLKMVNTTGKTLDTSFVQVNVGNEGGDPGTLVIGKPTDPITGSLKAGASAQGTYAFLLADATSAPVTVSVYVTSGQPVVTFRGRAT
jgi:hypothetical protein